MQKFITHKVFVIQTNCLQLYNCLILFLKKLVLDKNIDRRNVIM